MTGVCTALTIYTRESGCYKRVSISFNIYKLSHVEIDVKFQKLTCARYKTLGIDRHLKLNLGNRVKVLFSVQVFPIEESEVRGEVRIARCVETVEMFGERL